MVMFVSSLVGPDFIDMYVGRIVTAPKNTGPSNVPMRNHFDRTRSKYSRWNTTASLRMLTLATHALLDARGADLLEEDLVQRRLHQLEALDRSPGVHHAAQQRLRIGARSKLDFVVAVLV